LSRVSSIFMVILREGDGRARNSPGAAGLLSEGGAARGAALEDLVEQERLSLLAAHLLPAIQELIGRRPGQPDVDGQRRFSAAEHRQPAR
jgi:hypothetical protein